MLTLDQIKQFYSERENISERNMLREYLQYKILEIIFASKYSPKLSFIGGTAIRIVYGSDCFSEDLDFDNFGLTKTEFKNLAESIKNSLEKENFQLETKFAFKEAFRCYLKFKALLFEYGISSHEEEKLVIQLDTTRQKFATSPDLKIINKFGIFSELRVNPPDVLLSQKISAALGRTRIMGRDLYDIIYLASLTQPSFAYLEEKLEITETEELKSKIQNRLKEYNLDNLARDILPFVSKKESLKKIKKFDRWLEDWKLRE